MVLPAPVYSAAPYVINRLVGLARYPARTRKFFKFARKAGNFIVGNPFTKEGRASWALAATKIGIVYGGHKAYQKYRSMSKRPRISEATQEYPIAGASSVQQRAFTRVKSGKKPRKNAKLALKFLEATQSSVIERYQRIGAYETLAGTNTDGPGKLPISYQELTVLTEVMDAYPVYLFDLTSAAFRNRAGSLLDPRCQWRLQSFRSGTPAGTAGDFSWVSYNGQNRDGSATASHWIVERNTAQYQTSSTHPAFPGKSYLDWADIRLCLYGARKQTTKFTVSFIQFNDRAWDPLVSRTLTTPVDNMRSREEQDNYNAAWQEFVHPLVFHPMSSAGATKINLFKTLMKREYVINPDINDNSDANPPNVIVKLFKRMNRMCDHAWKDVPNIPFGGPDPPGQYIDQPVYNAFLGGQSLGTLHPRAKVFMMVTAQAYSKTGPIINTDTTPVMDVIIRKKHMFDNMTPGGLP